MAYPKPTKNILSNFGPWTAFVQGPLLKSRVMNVITTALNDGPVKNQSQLPQPRSAPVLGRSNVNIPAGVGPHYLHCYLPAELGNVGPTAQVPFGGHPFP